MKNGNMPPRARANTLELDSVLDEFIDSDGNELYPVELTLISLIIPFMFITAKDTSGIHYGLKQTINRRCHESIIKNIRGTPQYMDNMRYDVFAKIEISCIYLVPNSFTC